MDLFNTESVSNILPYDGIVNYFGKVLKQADSKLYYDSLLNHIEWKNDEAFIMGKHIITKRMVAWYADTDFKNTYSNIIKQAFPWTQEFLDLKSMTEIKTGRT